MASLIRRSSKVLASVATEAFSYVPYTWEHSRLTLIPLSILADLEDSMFVLPNELLQERFRTRLCSMEQ